MKKQPTHHSDPRRSRGNVVDYPGRKRTGTGISRARITSRTKGSTPAGKTVKKKIAPFYVWGDFDIPFLLLTLALLGFGLVMLFSASYARAYYYKDSSFYYIKKQMLYSLIGIFGMIVASFINYHWLEKFTWFLYGLSIILCLGCYFFDPYQGARRWIYIGGFSFQPSEIGKFALILVLAHLISRDRDQMGNLWKGTIRYLVYLAGIAAVVVMQPHLSATILLVAITVAMIYAGGGRVRHLIGVGATGMAAISALVFVFWDFFSDKFSHALVRLKYWLEPFATNDPGAYQTKQSLLAIGSGGLMGVGLGESRQKQLYLPEVQNDFVFAIVCEELGFIGASLIIILFALLIWRGYTIALHAKDSLGMLIAVGITTHIGLQALLNIAVVTNTIPNTGISLPMFSFGGTALCMTLAELGVLLAVSRQGVYEKE